MLNFNQKCSKCGGDLDTGFVCPKCHYSELVGLYVTKVSMPTDSINSESKPEPELKPFPCPVCGSEDVKQNRENNGILGPGYSSWVVSEICNNCGVLLSPGRKKFINSNMT
jgi:predicted RNA-binding Zn-ribbon protein involved in translation (DUF1610 family)